MTVKDRWKRWVMIAVWTLLLFVLRFEPREIPQWTETAVKCVVIQLLKEMSQSRLAAICPLSQVYCQ